MLTSSDVQGPKYPGISILQTGLRVVTGVAPESDVLVERDPVMIGAVAWVAEEEDEEAIVATVEDEVTPELDADMPELKMNGIDDVESSALSSVELES